MRYKDLLPTVVAGKLGSIINRISVREFDSFASALRHSSANAYQNEELCNVIADKTVARVQKAGERSIIMRPALAYLLNSIMRQMLVNENRAIVADYGGACGSHYYDAKRFLPDSVNLMWYVIETPQMVSSARSRGLESAELKFISSVPELKDRVNVIHTSCALHYVEKPYAEIAELASLGADTLIVNRMMLTGFDRDIISVQNSMLSSNGDGPLPAAYTDKRISYPYTALSYSRFISAMNNNGYTLEWEYEDHSEYHMVAGRNIAGRCMSFSRKVKQWPD